MRFSIAFIVLATLVSKSLAAVVEPAPKLCPDGTPGTIVSTTIIDGAPLTYSRCNTTSVEKRAPQATSSRSSEHVARGLDTSLTKRGYNLCGAPCTTYCESGSGGPNPNDCAHIATQYEGSGQFGLTQGYHYTIDYKSCRVSIFADDQDIYYCWDTKNFAGVINYVATHCQSQQGANGGTCQFYGNTDIAYIQVGTV